MKAKEIGISLIRSSIVPPTVGFIMAWLVKHNVTQIKSEWVFTIVTLLFSGAYYLVLRAVEVISENKKVMKWVGIFLGYPRIEQVQNEKVVPEVPVENLVQPKGKRWYWKS